MYLATLITLIVQGCNMGSRMIATLFAIELGANPFTVGLLISAYSVLPLLLSVYSGRVSDRFGARYPMLAGAIAPQGDVVLGAALEKIPGDTGQSPARDFAQVRDVVCVFQVHNVDTQRLTAGGAIIFNSRLCCGAVS